MPIEFKILDINPQSNVVSVMYYTGETHEVDEEYIDVEEVLDDKGNVVSHSETPRTRKVEREKEYLNNIATPPVDIENEEALLGYLRQYGVANYTPPPPPKTRHLIGRRFS